MQKQSESKYEGKVIGLVKGKIVISSISARKVMNYLITNYPDEEISLSYIPKINKIFIFRLIDQMLVKFHIR